MTDTPDSQSEAIRRGTREIWTRMRHLVVASIDLLERTAGVAQERPLTETERAAAQHEAHTLAGSLGLFGFPDASVAARELDQMLESVDFQPQRMATLVRAINSVLDTDQPQ